MDWPIIVDGWFVIHNGQYVNWSTKWMVVSNEYDKEDFSEMRKCYDQCIPDKKFHLICTLPSFHKTDKHLTYDPITFICDYSYYKCIRMISTLSLSFWLWQNNYENDNDSSNDSHDDNDCVIITMISWRSYNNTHNRNNKEHNKRSSKFLDQNAVWNVSLQALSIKSMA